MRLNSRLFAAAAVFLIACAYFASFADYGFNREDEGALLLQFWRWSQGEIPYRDFHFGYTPGVHFVHKTLMQWLGPDVLPGRYLLAAVNAGACTALFVISSLLTSSWKWALLAPLLYIAAIPVYPGDFASFNSPYPVWYNVLIFGIAAVMMPALRARPTLLMLLVAGALAGLNFTFKPNVGLFHLAAVAFVCLAAHGKPSTARDRALWWTWWLAVQLGLLFVFSSAPTKGEVISFLAPVAACAIAIARDAYRAPARRDVPSLFACALALGGGFLLVGTPWLVWAYSILGPEWFARRALFLGAGFEEIFYMGSPPFRLGLFAVAASAILWFSPAWLRARGWQPWPLLVSASAGLAALFSILVLTRPMPSGLYESLMTNLEPRAFAAATFVQWLAIFAWFARRSPRPDSDRLGPLIVCGVLLYLQIFPRTDYMHWVTAVPLLFPLVVWGLQALTIRWSIGADAGSRRIVGLAVLTPVLALAMLRIGHFVDARWDLEGMVPVRTPETTLAIGHAPLRMNVGQAERYRNLEETVRLLHEHTQDSDPVFMFPALDLVSYLALRNPGNRLGYYFPGWPAHDGEAEVLTVLERTPPKLAVVLREHQYFFSSAHAYYFMFSEFFERHYETAATFGPYAVLARKDLHLSRADRPYEGGSAVAEALGGARLETFRRLQDSSSSADRMQAVGQMSEWKIVSDFEPLRAALADEDPEVRSAAVKASGGTRSPEVRDALIAGVEAGAFTSADSVLALRAASTACDGSCLAGLVPLLESPDWPTSGAARFALSSLPQRRWLSSFWWNAGLGADGAPIEGAAAKTLREAVADPDKEWLLRELGFAHAGELGFGRCPRLLRKWAGMRSEWIGLGNRTALLALLHLARHDCPGDRLDLALRWLLWEPVLATRVALLEARRNPATADFKISRYAVANLGGATVKALWICSVVGGPACLDAAQTKLATSGSEPERVAAAWTWSQLVATEEGLDELRSLIARDASPQVRETARHGLTRRAQRLAARIEAPGEL